MTRALALSLLLCTLAAPSFAMSEQANPTVPGTQTQLADPDEKDNFSGAANSPYAQNGREQQLLGGPSTGGQTYGFGSPGGSLSYGFGQGAGFSSQGFR